MPCQRGVHAQVRALCVHEGTPHYMEKELGLNGDRHPEDRDAQVVPSGALLTCFAHAAPSWLERKPLHCCLMGDPVLCLNVFSSDTSEGNNCTRGDVALHGKGNRSIGDRHLEDRDAQLGPSWGLFAILAHTTPSWLE